MDAGERIAVAEARAHKRDRRVVVGDRVGDEEHALGVPEQLSHRRHQRQPSLLGPHAAARQH
jgi:hypothetical protein